MKNTFILIIAAAYIFSFSACQKKEEQAVQQQKKATGPIIADTSSTLGGVTIEQQEFQVVIPDLIKSDWSDIVLILEDREKGEAKEYRVKAGEKFDVPDSDLLIKVGPFLPDLTIIGSVITSASNEPNNPSIGIVIYEKGFQIFPQSGKEWGWLYANLPTIHAVKHERFRLVLKEGIKSTP